MTLVAARANIRRRTLSGDRAGRAARLPHPDDDRRPSVGDRHRRHGPADPLQRASPPPAARSRRRATSIRCCSTRPAPSLSATAWRRSFCRSPASARGRSPRPRCSRASPTKPRRAARSWRSPRRDYGLPEPDLDRRRADRAFRRADAPVRRRRRRPVDPQGRRRRDPAARRDSTAQAAGRIPPGGRADRTRGGTPLAVADDGALLGVIHLKDIVKPGIKERFAELRAHGHPHGDGDGRQSRHRRGDRLGGRRRRLPRRGDAGGQARLYPQGAVRRPADRHVRRRHQRRARARPGRRRRRHADRHAGRARGRQHGRSRLQPDQAHRDRRDRQAAADDARLADHLLDRQRRRQIFRHPAGAVRRRPIPSSARSTSCASPRRSRRSCRR